jgi:molybdate transport system substrate-binding protein
MKRRCFALGGVVWLGAVQAQNNTLTVSVASSLGDSLAPIARSFEAAQPGLQVRLNLGASGALLQQIAHGAPADVLVSADSDTIDSGVQRGLLQSAGRQEFASNRLVLVVPISNSSLTRLNDLASAEVRRMAMGKVATVPAGRYARQALDAARLWPAVQRKVVPADNVRQVLDYVARGEVDAGFVYATDAASLPTQVRAIALDADLSPVRYVAAVVQGSRQAALAALFTQHLRGASAQAVLKAAGFGPP